MKIARASRCCILMLLLCASLPPAMAQAAPEIAQVERAVFAATNELRRGQKQQKLDTEPLLRQTALEFARFMAQTGKYGHEADGRSPQERAKTQGYDYCIVAENIAYFFSQKPIEADQLARRFMRGWENSPGHRANMLNADLTQIGVAIVRSETTGYYYAVQLFGRPRSEAVSFQIENKTGATISYMLGESSLSLPSSTTRTHRQCGRTALRLGATAVTPSHNGRYAVVREGVTGFRLVTQ